MSRRMEGVRGGRSRHAAPAHPDASLADLYDSDLLPPNLRRAHHALDRTVDRLYRRTGFVSANVSNICLCSTRRCARRWRR